MNDKPKVALVGEDGNAFAIIGRCRRAARRAGWTEPQIAAFTKTATAGDYGHLLRSVMDAFDTTGSDDD